MTQEDEILLRQDLSARTPYGVKVHTNKGPQTLLGMNFRGWESILLDLQLDWNHCLFKPYLRPMSSMTEEEKKEYKALCIEETFTFATWEKVKWHDTWESIDWLNKHHFDYRGLIEKGLALEAPKGMYNSLKK